MFYTHNHGLVIERSDVWPLVVGNLTELHEAASTEAV